MPTRRSSARWLAAFAASLLLMPLATAQQPVAEEAPVLRPGPQLLAEGIPALRRLPPRPAANDDAPAPRLLGWHPERPELLLLARRDGSPQLHTLAAPLGRSEAWTRGREGVEGARWEPGGRYLVLRRDQGGDEAWRLYRLDRAGGDAARIVPAAGRVSDYQFVPGGGLVYLWEQIDREASQREPRSRLVWVDPLEPERARVLLDEPQVRFGALQVAPDGSLFFTRSASGRTQRLRWAPPWSGKPELLDRGSAPQAGEPALWSIQTLDQDRRHLVRTGVRSAQRESLLTELPGDLEAIATPPAGSGLPLALVHNVDGFSQLRLMPAGAAAEVRLVAAELPPGVIRSPHWHPSRPWLAFEHVSAQSAGRVVVYDQTSGQLVDWTEAQRGTGGPQWQRLAWTSFDGLGISALHVPPPERFSGARPVVISLHGGPSSQARPGQLSPLHRRLREELGAHIVLPNVRGSSGFGQRFQDLDNGRRREDVVKDVSALLDLIGKREDMDAKRVVVEGGSYGGYLSLAVAVHESPRIAGSICRVGIANFVTFLENTESYRRDNRRAEYGDERDPAMREFLQRISPANRAEAIRKPLFVVHGRNDPRVPYGEAEQIVAAVRRHGTPVWLLAADDEGHSFIKADNREYLAAAQFEFVRRLVEGRALD